MEERHNLLVASPTGDFARCGVGLLAQSDFPREALNTQFADENWKQPERLLDWRSQPSRSRRELKREIVVVYLNMVDA
jgi:hypothetical protein